MSTLDRSFRLSAQVWLQAATFLVLIFLPASADELNSDPREFFTKHIQPIFASKCWACHTDSKLGGLRLDSLESVVKGGKSGPAIVPGDADNSLLIKAISYTHERLKMPPTGKLDVADISALRKWVKEGAHWPSKDQPSVASAYLITPEKRDFWSFQLLRTPDRPMVKNTLWPRSAIDYFILSKLE